MESRTPFGVWKLTLVTEKTIRKLCCLRKQTFGLSRPDERPRGFKLLENREAEVIRKIERNLTVGWAEG